MSIKTKWLGENSNIILLSVEGAWTWQDYQIAMEDMYRMMAESDYDKIDYILDMSNAPILPDNVLSRMQKVSQNKHPKSGHMVVIGVNRYIKLLFDLMKNIVPAHMKFISISTTIEDARRELNEKYANIEVTH